LEAALVLQKSSDGVVLAINKPANKKTIKGVSFLSIDFVKYIVLII
jgi:hypothetical protein